VSDLDFVVGAALDAQVPLRLDRRPAWDDVLAQAGVVPARGGQRGRRRTWGRRRRVLLALALVLVGVVVVGSALAALGHDPFGSLTAWVSGRPGTPAPAAEQAGFAERNNASYAAFPKNVKLRLLLQESVASKTFSLLGFRNGHSLCLRLVPSAAPAVRGVNQCVTLRELRHSAAPALVVSTAYFGIKGGTVAAIFGFADDTVRTVEVTRSLGGRQPVTPTSNVFLALERSPKLGIYDPIVLIRARTRTGRRITVPFTSDGVVPLPTTPSYLRRTPVVLPGPTKVETTLPRTAIAWVDKREQRGEAFTPSLREFGSKSTHVLFARTIQPDPDDAYRIGISVIRVGILAPHVRYAIGPTYGKSIRLRPGLLLLCHAELFPLRPAPVGYLCSANLGSGSLFEKPGRLLTVNRTYREAFTRVAGLAADGIREIDLYLASGRVIPAALHDNAYMVQAPSAQWPAKLVAYDAAHHAVEVDTIDYASPSRSVLTPCPAATPNGTVPPTSPKGYERIDVGTGAVDGHTLLGRSVADVEQALGSPDATGGNELLYGLTASGNVSLTIYFDRARAVWLEYRDPNVVDKRLGRVLRLQPTALQRDVVKAYPGYERAFAYGSEPALLGCSGVLRTRDGVRELAFGLDPRQPSQLFLRLSMPKQ
jgi:hypothetical protein